MTKITIKILLGLNLKTRDFVRTKNIFNIFLKFSN